MSPNWIGALTNELNRRVNLPNPNPSLLFIIGHDICDHLKMCKNPYPNHKLNPEPHR